MWPQSVKPCSEAIGKGINGLVQPCDMREGILHSWSKWLEDQSPGGPDVVSGTNQ